MASRDRNAAIQPDQWVEDHKERNELLEPDSAPSLKGVAGHSPSPRELSMPGPGPSVPILVPTRKVRVLVPATGRWLAV